MLFVKMLSLNGIVCKNSFIKTNNITTTKDFYNAMDLSVTASNMTFSGEVEGKADINAISFQMRTKENNEDIICYIAGDLNYTSKKEIQIDDRCCYR